MQSTPRVPLAGLGFAALLAAGCLDVDLSSTDGELPTDEYNELELAAGDLVLYEVQARTANACDPDVGAWWQRADCASKIAPSIPYRAEDASCGELDELSRIRLGTLDDLLADTADYRAGITLRYIDGRVGANAVWLMPVFPDNDRWSIPDGCDNLGSPYAVRDYLHARGTLDAWCIERGRDEYAGEPCWGNGALQDVIDAAHARGMKVFLDVALNHVGHNYLFYDYAELTPVRARIARGDDLGALWDFAGTYEEALLYPELLDTPAGLDALAASDPALAAELDALLERCPDLTGDALVRAFATWRVALDHERASFACTGLLEFDAPGFYLGSNHWDPATWFGDTYSSSWSDVKFLFHQEGNWHQHEFVRQREYLFRVLNYWVSRGVDGFRLDHTTDYFSGMGPNEWDYLISKVDYYAWRRGQERPVFLAEEFHDQQGMNHVADILTEGWLGDMTGRGGVVKDAGHVEWVVNNMGRFDQHSFVMTALETHDELRLTDDTGFDSWTGAGFWGIGAAQRGTPMLLMGQEFGARRRLAFRKSDYLRSRFEGTDEYRSFGDDLVAFYRLMIDSRLDEANRALRAPSYRLLRSRWTGEADPRIVAQARWSADGNAMFVFHNLWYQPVTQSYVVPDDAADAMGIDRDRSYRVRDVMSGAQLGPCHRGRDLIGDFYVSLDAGQRMQWLRLELCEP